MSVVYLLLVCIMYVKLNVANVHKITSDIVFGFVYEIFISEDVNLLKI